MAVATTKTDPLFGRAGWTYVSVVAGPVRGPQPRLAQGTGRTGRHTQGTGAQLPGYMSDNDYRMSPYEYQPQGHMSFFHIGPHTVHTETRASQLGSSYRSDAPDNYEQIVPRSISVGTNGRDLVGTYQPHDFIPGQRFNHQMRSAPNWQLWAYPPDFRNTIQWQQVMKYRVQSHTISAQPLAQSNYFLGYSVQPEIGAQIGQNTLGYMGSV
jgi:hypothetical protein